MKVNAIKCKGCGDIIYSRAIHDFHWCSCHKCAVDGGFDYFKIVGNREDWETVDMDVLPYLSTSEAMRALYDDWNNKTEKYGLVKEQK